MRTGNWVNNQFQLDALGEALLLLAAADGRGRLTDDGRKAVTTLVAAIGKRQDEPDAGIWEIDDRRWAHSRLMCAAGLRAAAPSSAANTGDTESWRRHADELVASVNRDCGHPTGRWQRSPGDDAVDAALLLPGDPRSGRPRRPSQPRHRHRGPRGPDRRRLRVPVPPATPTGPCTKPRAPSSCAGSSCPWPS